MLLFDQNISPKITNLLKDKYPGAVHLRYVGMEDAADSEIFAFARSNNLHIVTFDADFADLSVIKGHPPKIIWLRTGNMTTLSISNLLAKNEERISAFISDKNAAYGVLEIH